MIQITDSEWAIMEVLWKENPLLAKEIREELTDKYWSFGTLKTLINRLHKKNAISYEVQGKAYLYSPIITKEEARLIERENFIQKVFKGSKNELLLNLVKDTKLSEDEITVLRKMLDEKSEED